MKKQIIILMIAMFSLGIVTANIGNIFNNFEDAEVFIGNEKSSYENYRNRLSFNYEYTSDKHCDYIFQQGRYDCKICYEITSPINYENCASVPMNTTRVEDDALIDEMIRDLLSENYNYSDVEVNVRDEDGRRF